MISDAKCKGYAVDVYSDQSAIEGGPWTRVGVFSCLPEAIGACKQVIDSFLYQSHKHHLDTESLIRQFLNYGDVPCIRGMEKFDPYLYLSEKCSELASKQQHPDYRSS